MDGLGKKYACIIVDDRELDRLTVVSHARRALFLHIAGVFESSARALEFARKDPPDVLFLDIDMPGINGLDLRKQLEQIPACIFITSYPEYALESFEAAAFDFLVKPVRSDRFEKCMGRLKDFLEIRHKAGLLDYTLGDDTIFIKDGHDHIKLQLHDVIYLEALKDYTGIVTPQKKYCVLTPLSHLLKEKSFKSFIRIHRSYAVQKHFIHKITPKEVMVNNLSLPIGRTYKDSLDQLLT
ncbi:LytTR family DNA-binding domain-containing protein [Flavitalea sp. BT771]|uniref:LytR/AlgR family response regulator transcription factor n=1 Tax=Flavitalea sp. BT771 TaxID=3063329 RepID=UPI0026E3D791|nr:LytTR family DNA-binding domain-containing protein [Flavitalea sp. BT771]MDO6430041.1 LytTR family DNA-binding domain-containing protein [Flavitalea sp. BT771]MDV6219820.1 LytTR family DNA-binding domain-containing protein [Flavitalea sp. BT771]